MYQYKVGKNQLTRNHHIRANTTVPPKATPITTEAHRGKGSFGPSSPVGDGTMFAGWVDETMMLGDGVTGGTCVEDIATDVDVSDTSLAERSGERSAVVLSD